MKAGKGATEGGKKAGGGGGNRKALVAAALAEAAVVVVGEVVLEVNGCDGSRGMANKSGSEAAVESAPHFCGVEVT